MRGIAKKREREEEREGSRKSENGKAFEGKYCAAPFRGIVAPHQNPVESGLC